MTVHPFIRPGQPQAETQSGEQLQAFSEQFWEDEEEQRRPSVTWGGLRATLACALVGALIWWCAWRLVAWAVLGPQG